MATKTYHVFFDNTGETTGGTNLVLQNRCANDVLLISSHRTATSVNISVFGKPRDSSTFKQLTMYDNSNYKDFQIGALNSSYTVDCVGYKEIKIELSNIVGGQVTVIGEVMD